MEASANPAGKVSVTETVPLVGPPVAELVTVIVYEPACPWEKAPLCDFWTARAGGAVIVSVTFTAWGLLEAPEATRLTAPL